MAIVKTVSINYERKINLGNYQSGTVGGSIWADLEPGENLDAAVTSLWSWLRATVREQATPLLKASGQPAPEPDPMPAPENLHSPDPAECIEINGNGDNVRTVVKGDGTIIGFIDGYGKLVPAGPAPINPLADAETKPQANPKKGTGK